MKKIVSFILIFILGILLIFFLGKNIIVKTAVEAGTKVVTGLPLQIHDLDIGILKPLVSISDLKLHNPEGYPDPVMLDVPVIYVDYDLPAILKGKVHLHELKFHMNEFVVVKNKAGELNINALRSVQEKKKDPKATPEGKGKVPDIQIDQMELKIGKVVYKDYSKSETPSVKEFNINLDERYQDISDPYTLVNLIVVKALMKTSIASLADFNLEGLKGTVLDSLKGVEGITNGTVDTLKKSADDLKNMIKLPFGKQK